MIEHGTILNVEVETLGSELSANVAIGASVIPVRSTIDFLDVEGSLTIGTETHTYAADAVDDEGLTVTLDTPLTGAYLEGEFVYVAPAPVVRYWAHVQVDGDDDDVILAEISRPLVMMTEQGARDPDQQETAAVLEERDGVWSVVDILGLEPVIIGTAIYVPDTDDPNFTVDSDGLLSAKGVTIYPVDGTNVPLIIKDTLGVGGDWTQWRDSTDHVLVQVTRLGGILANDNIATYGEMGINAVAGGFPDLTLRFSSGVGTWGSIVFSPADGSFEVGLLRTANHEITLGDILGSTPTAFRVVGDITTVGGNVFVDEKVVFSTDTRLRRTAAKELTLDDTAAGPADLVVLGDLFMKGTTASFIEFTAQGSAPAAPAAGAGRLRLYVTLDLSGHPQFHIKNSNGSVATPTTFSDGS